jgi:hypothetical protein
MLVHYGAACALGAFAGAAFAWIWLRIAPRGTNRRFWSAMAGLTREMLRVDETGEFLRLYRRLAVLLGKYVARNLGGALLGCLPMIVILLTVAPLVFKSWDAHAPGGYVERTAYCSTPGWCTTFAALDFKVVEVPPNDKDTPYAVVRAEHGDRNPLWPFLSDIEAAFFAAFILSTFIGLLWPLPRASLRPATTP